MPLEKLSGCKINLLLNILGKRADGFHDLETVMQPVPLYDELRFEPRPSGIELTCNHPRLPVGPENLVYRAAEKFFAESGPKAGIRIHLEKRIPLAAGLGGGSGNAATTLIALNESFDQPLGNAALRKIAAELGSDVPFFLENKPAIALGRGEEVRPLEPFPALRGRSLILVYPGFGVSTAWAYQALARFPKLLSGTPGRAERLVQTLAGGDLSAAAGQFFNSLEGPVLEKYPLLALIQDFFREQGVIGTLMSGSGSTTFAVVKERAMAEEMVAKLNLKFEANFWTTIVGW